MGAGNIYDSYSRLAVRISMDQEKELKGSGVLLAKNYNGEALILTAFHVVSEFLSLADKHKLNCNKEKHVMLMHLNLNEQGAPRLIQIPLENACNILKHPSAIYINNEKMKEDNRLEFDAAIIKVPYQDWMKSLPLFSLRDAHQQETQIGWGYPNVHKNDGIHARFTREGKISNNDPNNWYDTMSYVANDIGMVARDEINVGFSGTGMFFNPKGFDDLIMNLSGVISCGAGSSIAGAEMKIARASLFRDIMLENNLEVQDTFENEGGLHNENCAEKAERENAYQALLRENWRQFRKLKQKKFVGGEFEIEKVFYQPKLSEELNFAGTVQKGYFISAANGYGKSTLAQTIFLAATYSQYKRYLEENQLEHFDSSIEAFYKGIQNSYHLYTNRKVFYIFARDFSNVEVEDDIILTISRKLAGENGSESTLKMAENLRKIIIEEDILLIVDGIDEIEQDDNSYFVSGNCGQNRIQIIYNKLLGVFRSQSNIDMILTARETKINGQEAFDFIKICDWEWENHQERYIQLIKKYQKYCRENLTLNEIKELFEKSRYLKDLCRTPFMIMLVCIFATKRIKEDQLIASILDEMVTRYALDAKDNIRTFMCFVLGNVAIEMLKNENFFIEDDKNKWLGLINTSAELEYLKVKDIFLPKGSRNIQTVNELENEGCLSDEEKYELFLVKTGLLKKISTRYQFISPTIMAEYLAAKTLRMKAANKNLLYGVIVDEVFSLPDSHKYKVIEMMLTYQPFGDKWIEDGDGIVIMFYLAREIMTRLMLEYNYCNNQEERNNILILIKRYRNCEFAYNPMIRERNSVKDRVCCELIDNFLKDK